MTTTKISGNVTDSEGFPLVGVNIFPLVNGKTINIGTITDIDGNYEWENVQISNDSVIKFSYLGKKPITFKASELKNKDVVMLDASEELAEVVVVAKKKKQQKFTDKQKKIMMIAGIVACVSLVGIIYYKNR